MNTLAVRAQDVRKSFLIRESGQTVHAVNGVSLDVATGQITALVGPDGAGKTTLLRMICGLTPPAAGQLLVLGFDVSRTPQEVQNRISYMPQRFGLYEDLTVQENMDLYADLHGVPPEVRHKRHVALLEMMNLSHFTSRLAGKLSGGMKQKLGLACTLVRSPDLLLLDEPTAGVDPLSRRELWTVLKRLEKEENLTVLVSTAYLDEAALCEKVFVMHEGQVIAHGTPQELAQRASGHCFVSALPQGMLARNVQARLLDDVSTIVDAVPEGGNVRYTVRNGIAPDTLPARFNLTPHAVPSRLEDGFMWLLKEHVANQKQEALSPSGSEDVSPAPPAALQAGTDAPVVIEVRDLVRKFGDFTAVDSTSFSVRRGEIFGLLGPNGAGKTTTFRMLCGLLPATSGLLRVAGLDLRTARAQARSNIGYVAQNFSLYGSLTVDENLHFFAGIYGLRGKRMKERIAAVKQAFDLNEDNGLPCGILPGGFKQRLAMATGLLHEPQILFLDEPTSGIDALARRLFWRRITALAETGTTIIITTHFMEEAEYCDRMMIQDAGKLLAIGTPGEVRRNAGKDVLTMEEAFIRIVEKNRALAAEKKP